MKYVTLIVAMLLASCDRSPKSVTTTDDTGKTHTEAPAFKGQAYHTVSGKSSIVLISADELEFRVPHGDTFLCKYTDTPDALRIVMTTLGTPQVRYLKHTAAGLQEEDGTIYLTAAAQAELATAAIDVKRDPTTSPSDRNPATSPAKRTPRFELVE